MQIKSADELMTNQLCVNIWRSAVLLSTRQKNTIKMHNNNTWNIKDIHAMLQHSKTQAINVDSFEKCLQSACQHLKSGEIIAIPTDTVYGLACDANNTPTIQKLYELKGREAVKPVSICVKDIAALKRYGQAEHLPDELLQCLLPGAVTIVVKRSSKLSNPLLNPHTSNIGIRIPDSEFIQKLCALFDAPLALTSANRSAKPSSLNVFEFEELWPTLAAVYDAGQLAFSEEQRAASTVMDLSQPGYYQIIRAGIALQQCLHYLHDFELKPIIADNLNLNQI